jgi:endonuclease YncB( thermonuclease family)
MEDFMAQTNRLEIAGTLDLGQFWPAGKSDADTTKLRLSIAAGGVRVRLAGQTQFQTTTAYEGAGIPGKKDADTGTAKLEPVIKNSTLTVRLQRIDAPELHYRPDAKGSDGKLKGTGLIKDYRQNQAETAVVKLAQFLGSFGNDPLPCTFTSELKASDSPGAAIDKYGRFVGDIILPDGTNLNVWLLQQGLAVIALYDSMLPAEIDESIAAWQAGRKKQGSVARHYTDRFGKFDPTLVFRAVASEVVDEGELKFLHPKFYRRQTTWWAFTQVQAFKGDLGDWLTQKAEVCWYLPEFRQLGKKAQKYPLYERGFDGDGIGWDPEDFIFAESPSSIQRETTGGKLSKVTDW